MSSRRTRADAGETKYVYFDDLRQDLENIRL